MKARVCVVVAAVLAVWALKHHYATAQADDLWWVLTPTAALVERTTGAVFTATPGEGYFSRERLFLIEKSCAGVNFMVAAFAMLVCTFFRRVATGTSGTVVLGVSLVASYAAAVAVNTVRISIAMWLGPHSVDLFAVSAAGAHRVQGIAVYFGGLLLLYEVASRADRVALMPPFSRIEVQAAVSRASRGAAVPLAAYYAVTLGIPLARGVVSLEARVVDHAVAVILVPLLMVVLAGALHHGKRRADYVGDEEPRTTLWG